MILRTLSLPEDLDNYLYSLARSENKSKSLVMVDLILFALKKQNKLPDGLEEKCHKAIEQHLAVLETEKPISEKVIVFIDNYLNQIFKYAPTENGSTPWGPLIAVEGIILTLLEIRERLENPDLVNHRKLLDAFTDFIRKEIPNATVCPLCVQMEESGQQSKYYDLMKKFVDQYTRQA